MTVLIAIVAVFISYSANQGLPFVPTYRLKAELPERARSSWRATTCARAGSASAASTTSPRCAAQVNGQRARRSPCSTSSSTRRSSRCRWTRAVGVRSRSALGLKYVELLPGRSERTFEDGATIPLRNATPPAPELEDVLSTFQPAHPRRTRRRRCSGFGDGLAGRGPDINETIAAAAAVPGPPRPRSCATCRARSSELRNLFPALGRARPPRWRRWPRSRRSCSPSWPTPSPPSAATRRRSRRRSRRPRRRSTPPPRRSGCRRRSWRASPTCRAASSRPPPSCDARCRRSTARSPPACPPSSSTPELSDDLEELFEALEDLSREPEHAARAAATCAARPRSPKPAVEHVAPYQTVCNYLVYFFNPLGTHLSEAVPGRHGRAHPRQAASSARSRTRSARPSRSARWTSRPTRTRTRAPSRRCTRSPTARRSTRRAARTARPGRPATPAGSSPTARWPAATDAGPTSGRRQPRGASTADTPGPRRRHLQVAPARHRQPEGRAMSASPRQACWRSVVIVVAVYFGFTKVEPVREPIRAAAPSCATPRTSSRARRCGSAGVEVGQGHQDRGARATARRPRRVTMELRDDALPIHRDARAADPAADPARGELLRRPRSRARRPPASCDDGSTDPGHADGHLGDAAARSWPCSPRTPAPTSRRCCASTARRRSATAARRRSTARSRPRAGLPPGPRSPTRRCSGEQPNRDLRRLLRGQTRDRGRAGRQPGGAEGPRHRPQHRPRARSRARTPRSPRRCPPCATRCAWATRRSATLDAALPTLRAFSRRGAARRASTVPTLDAAIPWIAQARGAGAAGRAARAWRPTCARPCPAS